MKSKIKIGLCLLMVAALSLAAVMTLNNNRSVLEISDDGVPLASGASNAFSFGAVSKEAGPESFAEVGAPFDEGNLPAAPDATPGTAETENIIVEIERNDASPVGDQPTGDVDDGDADDETGGTTGETGDDAGESESDASGGEVPALLSLNVAQFIPNANYGLFGKAGSDLINLNGATLTLGREYTLAMNLRIDRPVAANELYTYKLPVELTGNPDAAPQTYSSADGALATCQITGNELRLVFTDLGAEVLNTGGNAFDLTYSFKETLNAAAIGAYTQFTATLPTATGYQTIEFHVDGHQTAADAPEAPQPILNPEIHEESIIPTVTPEPLCGQAESDGHTHTEDCYVAQGEANGPQVTRKVLLGYRKDAVAQVGDPLTLYATLEGYDDVEVALQWQYDAGEGWVNAPGDSNDLEYQTEVNEQTMRSQWQLEVTVIGAKRSEGEPATIVTPPEPEN